MGATWHWGHVAKPRGPTQAPAWRGGDTWLLFLFIIYMIYNIYRSPDYQETSLLTPHSVAPYKLTCFNYFTRVGLSSTRFLTLQAKWINARHQIGGALEIRASIASTRGPPINHHTCVLLNRVITAMISRDQTHLTR